MKAALATIAIAMTGAITSAVAPAPAFAHCQIPCGIFDDQRAFAALEEHATTIERSLRGIAEASSAHDIARWTMNKEEHAKKIQDEAQAYFLAQRVKIVESGADGYDDYVTSTVMLHQIIVAAMKAKQTTDPSAVETLRARIAAYKEHYWKMHGHDH